MTEQVHETKVYKRKDLPDGYKVAAARRRADLRSRDKYPDWIDNRVIRERTFSVYSMYLKRHSLEEISNAHVNPNTGKSISINQIYKDINRARLASTILFEGKMNNIIMEQVEAHEGVIRDARRGIEMLEDSVITEIPETLPKNQRDFIASLKNVQGFTPAHARAKADFLRVITENEKAIEDLFAVRDKSRRSPVNPDAPKTDGMTVVVDMRSDSRDEHREVVVRP